MTGARARVPSPTPSLWSDYVRVRASPKTLLLAAAAIGFITPIGVEAQEHDEWAMGSWSGSLVAGPQTLEIIFHVTESESGALTGTMDVPAQGATGIPLTTVDVEDGKMTLTFPVPGGGTYEGTVNEAGDAITGSFTQAGQSFPMNLERAEGASGPPLRPQDPVEPFPYTATDVQFDNEPDAITLAGTLTLPEGEGPFPGVVLVSGSGPQDRDESLMGHRPFLVLADHLTRAGIAVLRYDDRGVAASGGDFPSATSEDFARDALAAVAHLAAHPSVATDRVGIAGHSEGGIIAPMAASWSETVAFVVMLAGPGVPGIDILVAQGELINRASGSPEEITALNVRIQRSLADIIAEVADPAEAAPLLEAAMRTELETLSPELRAAAGEALGDQAIEQTVAQMNSPWFRYFLHYDPRPALEAVRVPTLALLGGKDLQVPADLNRPEIEAAFNRSGLSDASVETLPGLNHLFQEADTGSPAEYVTIEQTFSPIALERISAWVLERFGRPITQPTP